MAVHPHDTDRILGVLGDAITALRKQAWDSEDTSLNVANDLALLHGAVSAERDQPKVSGSTPRPWSGAETSPSLSNRGTSSTRCTSFRGVPSPRTST